MRALSSSALLMPRAATVRICGSPSRSARISAAAPGRRGAARGSTAPATASAVRRVGEADQLGDRRARAEAPGLEQRGIVTGVAASGEPPAMMSLKARVPSSPPILAIAVTASRCGAP